MRIGFDVDGVLANFSDRYEELIIGMTGKNLFKEPNTPTSWDWDLDAGYTKEERKATFDAIAASDDFWVQLQPLNDARWLAKCIHELYDLHEIYFVTNRRGQFVKSQTEAWLARHVDKYSDFYHPTVLITRHGVKGVICRALELDVYVDDNWDNVVDCYRESPNTRTYLLDKGYNQTPASVNHHVASEVNRRRIPALADLFVRESLLLPTAPPPAQ